jgi:hypothetical protein
LYRPNNIYDGAGRPDIELLWGPKYRKCGTRHEIFMAGKFTMRRANPEQIRRIG